VASKKVEYHQLILCDKLTKRDISSMEGWYTINGKIVRDHFGGGILAKHDDSVINGKDKIVLEIQWFVVVPSVDKTIEYPTQS
jgi:hypothetical protein